MDKICSSCKEQKSIQEFNIKRRGKDGLPRYQSFCKSCSRLASKNHYKNNKKNYLARNSKVKYKNREKLLEYFKDKKCADCPNTDSRVFEFDHLRDKKANVSKLILCNSWKTVLREIEKCEIVCANCHRIRTLERCNSYRIK